MNPYRTFTKRFLILLGTLLLGLVVINMGIDPFFFFDTPRIKGINAVRTELDRHERLYKASEIARLKPRAILLGSSRVMVGCSPEDLKSITGLKAYNGAFSSASFEEVYHYFEHALYHQPELKVVVVGVDLFSFGQKEKVKPDFTLSRLKRSTVCWEDATKSLFTLQALQCSLKTLHANLFTTLAPSHLPDGQMTHAYMTDPEKDVILRVGDDAYIQSVMEGPYKDYKIDELKVALFRNLVAKCQERDIVLKVFFSPAKASYWAAIYQSDTWSSLEEVKRQLSAIYPIWDFSGFNCVTTQAIEKESNPLYYECSHFRPVVGKMILDKMFGKTVYPDDFGRILH